MGPTYFDIGLRRSAGSWRALRRRRPARFGPVVVSRMAAGSGEWAAE